MSQFTITDKVLNINHTINRARSLYKLMSTYGETGVFRSKIECYYVSKELNLKYFTGF